MSLASPISYAPVSNNPLKRGFSLVSERLDAKQLKSYFREVTKNDSCLWKTTEKIAILEKQLQDLNKINPTAESCLALAWRVISNPQQSENLTPILERITKTLERTERGRLIKILYLIDGTPGRQLRDTLFPCFYHYGDTVRSGPSVKEFYKEAQELCQKLSTLTLEETAQLELPVVNKFQSLTERDEFLNSYSESLKRPIALLEQNREIIFPLYFPIWPNDKGTTWLTRSFSPKNNLKIGFSPILEGLETTTIFSGPGEKPAPEGFVELLADDPLEITTNSLCHISVIASVQHIKSLDGYIRPLHEQFRKMFSQTFAERELADFGQSTVVTSPDNFFAFEHFLVRLKYPDLQPKHWPQPRTSPATPRVVNSLVEWLNITLVKR